MLGTSNAGMGVMAAGLGRFQVRGLVSVIVGVDHENMGSVTMLMSMGVGPFQERRQLQPHDRQDQENRRCEALWVSLRSRSGLRHVEIGTGSGSTCQSWQRLKNVSSNSGCRVATFGWQRLGQGEEERRPGQGGAKQEVSTETKSCDAEAG